MPVKARQTLKTHVTRLSARKAIASLGAMLDRLLVRADGDEQALSERGVSGQRERSGVAFYAEQHGARPVEDYRGSAEIDRRKWHFTGPFATTPEQPARGSEITRSLDPPTESILSLEIRAHSEADTDAPLS